MSEADIAKLKSKSIEVGIPYQTIISSLIHNYASGKVKMGLWLFVLKIWYQETDLNCRPPAYETSALTN